MASKETPMMRQFNHIKQQHQDKILFFRMGDFYEMFGEDAVVASKALQIQLTTRNKNQESAMPMCGIPFHACEQYLNKLTSAGHKVAICDQVEDPAQATGLVKREVVRIITPGTIVSPELMEAGDNHYLGAFFPNLKKKWVGLSFCDLSTGEFEVTQVSLEEGIHRVLELLLIYRPKELLIPFSKSEKETQFIKEILQQVELSVSPPNGKSIAEYLDVYQFDYSNCKKALEEHFSTSSLAGFGIDSLKEGVCAAGAILQYLQETQKNALSHINQIRTIKRKDKMLLDESTLRNLEIFESPGSYKSQNSLLGLVDKTETPMGARLLRKWLSAPLLSAQEIQKRHDAVEEFLKQFTLCEEIREVFSDIGDLERNIVRISLPTVSILDLIRLRTSLSHLPRLTPLFQQLSSPLVSSLIEQHQDLKEMHEILESTFQEDPALKPKNGGFIREGIHEKLDELRNLTQNGKQLIANLEAKERQATKINGLKVKYNRVFGYYIEVSNASKHLVPDRYIRKQTLVNAERFITEELKELEESILTAEDESKALEFQLFEEVRQKFEEATPEIQGEAEIISQLDVLSCFAWLATMYNYIRPEMLNQSDSSKIEIVESRHPVIETLNFEEPFIPNDVSLSSDNHFIMLITGPNMGGKSTYMRQVALIAYMAQVGIYVPASQAKLPIFDRIFTRVGASDRLTRGESTFMVEMHEAASILHNATDQSLIILDEIGRGTSTFDGISIAWAIVEHLHKTKAITLFATHYHELTLLGEKLSGVCNYNVSVKEENDNIIFIRKIVAGSADKSYGIQVAKLAGLPPSVINKASEVLEKLEAAEQKFAGFEDEPKIRQASSVHEPEPIYHKRNTRSPSLQQESPQVEENLQMSFIPSEETWVKELLDFDLNHSTPFKAMEFLYELQKKVLV